MFTTRMCHWSAACLIVCTVVVVSAAAQDDRVTNDDLDRQMRAVWTKTILDAYDATADTNTPWHADARRFITGYIGQLSNVYPSSLELDSLNDLEKMGRLLLAAGCDEPIIHILYGRLLCAQNMPGEALPYLQIGYENARSIPNLQLLLGTTAVRISTCMRALGDDARANDYDVWAMIDMAEAVSNPMYDEDDQSALLEIVNNFFFSTLSLQQKKSFVYRCVAQEGSGEWLCKMLAGLMHLHVTTVANDNRWHDLADFDAEQSAIEAGRLLISAWQLGPQRPQAAAALVQLTSYVRNADLWPPGMKPADPQLQEGEFLLIPPNLEMYMGASASQLRVWFDLALTVQVDYVPAYEAYLRHSLRSSSREYLLEFGRKCLDRKDFDTIAPFYCVAAASQAAQGGSDSRYTPPREYLGRSNITNDLERMVKGYDEANLSGSLQTHVRLAQAAVACLMQDWPQAREYLESIEDLPSHMDQAERIFALLELDATDSIAQAYAKTGPAADALTEAYDAYRHQNYDAAIAILTDAARAHAGDPWTTEYLHYSIRYTMTTRDWMNGQWVNITPNVDLAGWKAVARSPWVDTNGRIVFAATSGSDNIYYSSPEWAALICDRSFADTYELRGKLSFIGDTGEGQTSAGPILGRYKNWSYWQYCAISMTPPRSVALRSRGWDRYQTAHELHSDNTFYVQVWRQNITAYVNGESVLSGYYNDDMPSGNFARSASLGVGSAESGRALPAVFTDIQVRRLTSQPKKNEFDRNDAVPFHISSYSPAYGDQPPSSTPPPTDDFKQPAEESTTQGEQDSDAGQKTQPWCPITIGAHTIYPPLDSPMTPEVIEEILHTLAKDDENFEVEQARAILKEAAGIRDDEDQDVDEAASSESTSDEDQAETTDESALPAPDTPEATTEDMPDSPAVDTPQAPADESRAVVSGADEDQQPVEDAPTAVPDAPEPAEEPAAQDATTTAPAESSVALETVNVAPAPKPPKVEKRKPLPPTNLPMAAGEPVPVFVPPSASGPAEEQAPDVQSPVAAEAPPAPAKVDDNLFRTDLLGSNNGVAFQDTITRPGYLIGLRLRFEKRDTTLVINAIQPIYHTAIGRRFGGRAGLGDGPPVDVVARDGYAVGALVSGGAASPGSLQVVFMRVTPQGRLDPNDAYRSQWYGPGGGDLQVTTEARLSVGLAGRMSSSLQAVGLVAADEPNLAGIEIPPGDPGPPAVLTPRAPADLVEFQGHYYRYFYTILPWRLADEYCRAMGGHLIKIDSQQEQDLAAALWNGSPRPAWIGAHTDATGQWLWPDATTLDFSFWLQGHPDVGGPNQAGQIGLDSTTRWINADDATWARFICEWDHDPRPAAGAAPGVLPGAVEFQEHWYRAFHDPVSLDQAKAICQAMGGYLVAIETQAENEFARSLSRAMWVLIGAAADEPGKWHWPEGKPITFSNWYTRNIGETADPALAAVLYTRTGQWDALNWRPNNWTTGFICEWDHAPAPDVLAAAAQAASDQLADGQNDSADDLDGLIQYCGHWYKIFYTPLDWHDARDKCRSLGGHLIHIEDEDEAVFAMLFATTEFPQLWIGASDEAEEGHWVWTDGTEITFSYWSEGEPNNYDDAEDAAVMRTILGFSQPGWNDLTADTNLAFICEWDRDPTPNADAPEDSGEQDTPTKQENGDD